MQMDQQARTVNEGLTEVAITPLLLLFLKTSEHKCLESPKDFRLCRILTSFWFVDILVRTSGSNKGCQIYNWETLETQKVTG